MFGKAGGLQSGRQVYSRIFRSAFAGWMHHALTWAEMQQVQVLTHASGSSNLGN